MTTKIQQAKEFAKRHQLVLVAATGAATGAVVGVVVTRQADARLFGKIAYVMGGHAGVLASHLDMAFNFIEDKGLMAEYEQYGPQFYEKITANK
jgi:hypothetical protein